MCEFCSSFIAGKCPDPGTVENAHKSPAFGPYHYGDQIVFTCNPGYTLEGDSAAVCTSTGQFNKILPTCVVENSGWHYFSLQKRFTFCK